jgi:hypothetical protein
VLLAVLIAIDEFPPSLVMLAGLNDAVAAAGNPAALNVTCCAVLPVVSAVLMADDSEVPPCVDVTDAGFAARVNELALTISETVVVWTVVPVPVTVIGYVPAGVSLVVVMVNDAVPPALLMTELGVKAAVAAVGDPVALSVTCCAALPVVSAAVIVEDPDAPPWVAVTEPGEALIEKSSCAAALTVSETVVERVTDPVPVTVSE